MNSDKNNSKTLPDGWVLCTSKSNPGRKYYFNKRTGKSSWSEPQVEEKSPLGKHKKRRCISHSDKNRVEAKTLKRKSGLKDGSPHKKKHKEETPTAEKLNQSAPSKTSPAKSLDTSTKESPSKPEAQKTTPKNTANARLSQLRLQLSQEISKEEGSSDASPSKKQRVSPTATQTETQPKTAKTELKSPNANDTKYSTTQSPSSDSLQSVPSPSQFFAANKILCSMKAQLPEEYCDKQKQKDTFADIEQGICNQTTDYPFMKHPATPPQFSEASKLMSAIKSKLSYKASPKETPIRIYSSAKERMEVLRNRLSSEIEENTSIESIAENKNASYGVMEETFSCKDVSYRSNDTSYYTCTDVSYSNKHERFASKDVSYVGESMDVDSKEVQNRVPLVQFPNDNADDGDKDLVLVVDTNIFIHELDFIQDVLNSHITGFTEQPTLLVPWRVINELDRLKDNNNGNGAICKRAKSAMDYLYKSLPENSRIKGQSLRDANSHIYPCEIPDDEILNCCLQQFERGKAVILLSNDKNLCNKAIVNGIRCSGQNELRPLLENNPAPAADPDACAGLRRYEAAMYELLASILENEMRAKYNNLWQHVLFKPPPWTLGDVLQCLLKHWIAVFSEVFPRIEHILADLSRSLNAIKNKDAMSLSEPEVSYFKDLCLDVARKCQIIPEYMELAKVTVERLMRSEESETDACEGDAEMRVIDAFEGLWTVYSSYCAKLATYLGVPHSLEDRLTDEAEAAAALGGASGSLSALAGRCQDFSMHTAAVAHALSGALLAAEAAGSSSEEAGEAASASLAAALRAGLAHAGAAAAAAPHADQLRRFCHTCRNMVQEAYSKFSQLSELLEVCKSKLPSE